MFAAQFMGSPDKNFFNKDDLNAAGGKLLDDSATVLDGGPTISELRPGPGRWCAPNPNRSKILAKMHLFIVAPKRAVNLLSKQPIRSGLRHRAKLRIRQMRHLDVYFTAKTAMWLVNPTLAVGFSTLSIRWPVMGNGINRQQRVSAPV